MNQAVHTSRHILRHSHDERLMKAIVLCVVTLLGCQTRSTQVSEQSASTKPPTAPSVLTVASYNVLYALAEESDADADTLEVASKIEADVIFFQETNEVWERALRGALGQRYPHCKFHHPVKLLPEGLGVCSKHPLLVEEQLPSVLGWFPAQRVQIAWPPQTFEAFNVHLRPAVADVPNWRAVNLETRGLREQEVRDYLSQRNAQLPTLLLGDFNELPESDLFQILKSASMDSALQQAGEKGVTWRWFGAEPPLEMQLDHVTYSSSAFRVQSVQILPGGRSDHSAVIVRLETL